VTDGNLNVRVNALSLDAVRARQHDLADLGVTQVYLNFENLAEAEDLIEQADTVSVAPGKTHIAKGVRAPTQLEFRVGLKSGLEAYWKRRFRTKSGQHERSELDLGMLIVLAEELHPSPEVKDGVRDLLREVIDAHDEKRAELRDDLQAVRMNQAKIHAALENLRGGPE
jgi:hypothetical protein